MKILIRNNITHIVSPSEEMLREFARELTFTDKAAQYQMKRLSKTVWGKTSQAYQDAAAKVHQKLYQKAKDDPEVWVIPTPLLGLLGSAKDASKTQDLRSNTGQDIALPWSSKMHPLRDYQQEAVDLMASEWRGTINLATGLGKTLTAVYAIRTIHKKTLVVTPNASIAKQFHGILSKAFGTHRVGYFGGGKLNIKDITVGIAASVANHVEDFKKAGLGLIIIDEAHHTPCDTAVKILNALSKTGKIFGLTATDFRSDGKDLLITAGCGPTLIRRDARWGILHKWLADPIFFIKYVPTTGKDYSDDKLKNYKAHVLNSPEMKAQILSDAKSCLSKGRATLILVDEVAHGQELAGQLGLKLATGKDKQSQMYIEDFNSGKTKGLIGTKAMISEGVDTQSVEALILATFSASKGNVLQSIGRALRITETKKKVIIFDYCPLGSHMLRRHSDLRISYYRELTTEVYLRLGGKEIVKDF